MAGYIFALNDLDSLKRMIEEGAYSTNLSKPQYVKSQERNQWRMHHEATFGDYFSMKEGDNVYFFIKRKIYGIGELINVKDGCISLNYPGALNPNENQYDKVKKKVIYNKEFEKSINNRLVCFFKPSPLFFKHGVDMDDVLASDPSAFRMLRAFWKLSFVKIDDEENNALKNILIKRNKEFLYDEDNNENIFDYSHQYINSAKKDINDEYMVFDKDIIEYASDPEYEDYIRHEMAIEASLIYNLSRKKESVNKIFKEWDYISHQVVASPFKAIDYMDKMDIFGYKFILDFNIISDYLIIEIKRDAATVETVDQVMKYVDWVNQEYSHKDYSMINAYIVAYEIPDDVVEYASKVAIRNFTKGTRPTTSEVWTNLKLVEYKRSNSCIEYILV